MDVSQLGQFLEKNKLNQTLSALDMLLSNAPANVLDDTYKFRDWLQDTKGDWAVRMFNSMLERYSRQTNHTREVYKPDNNWFRMRYRL